MFAGAPEAAAEADRILQLHWSGGPHLSQIHLLGLEKVKKIAVEEIIKAIDII